MEGDGHTQSIHQKDSIRIYLHNKLVKEIAFLKEDLIPNFEEDLSVEGCTWVKLKNLEKILFEQDNDFFPDMCLLMIQKHLGGLKTKLKTLEGLKANIQ